MVGQIIDLHNGAVRIYEKTISAYDFRIVSCLDLFPDTTLAKGE